MDFNRKHGRGLQIIFLTALKRRKSKEYYLIPILSNVEYHKDQFLVLCFSYYILMIYLPNCDLSSRVRMYADDTNLTYASADQSDISSMLNRNLETIHEWLKANRLSLNVTKTKYIC